MFNLFQLFPPYLILLTLVLVIFPTIAAFFLRIFLYKYLIDSAQKVNRLLTGASRGKQPKILDTLEARFKTASSQLEQVNTPALVDGVYSQEKFKFLGLSLPCEEWDYFSQALPNLLLAFGLLGTFLGITINLYNLSQSINLGGSDVNNLAQDLQTPLQSMGIAFITSLVALVCSSILLITNLRCNTNVAKNFLISCLEDYLDNVLKPTVEGDTRLDKAVNKMVEEQHDFLIRFHEKVGAVLEATFGRVADRMIEENKLANTLAREVYERFMESSGTIKNGADSFREASEILSSQVKMITEIIPKFQEYSQKLENGATVFQTAAHKIEQSKFSENLENITVDLAKTQQEYSQTTSFLGEKITEFVNNNKQATRRADKVYNQLEKASADFKDSALGFMEASEIIKQSDFPVKLQAATKDLVTIQQEFAASASMLNQSTQSIETAITNVQDSVKYLWEMGKEITQLNQKSGQIMDLTQQRLTQEAGGLSQIQAEINNLVQRFKTHEEKLNEQLHTLISSLGEKLGKNSQNLQAVVTSLNETKSEQTKLVNSLNNNFQALGNNLSQVMGENLTKNTNNLNKVAQNINETQAEQAKLVKNLNSNFQYLGDNITKVIVQENKNNNSQFKQYLNDLQAIKANLSKLVSLIDKNIQ